MDQTLAACAGWVEQVSRSLEATREDGRPPDAVPWLEQFRRGMRLRRRLDAEAPSDVARRTEFAATLQHVGERVLEEIDRVESGSQLHLSLTAQVERYLLDDSAYLASVGTRGDLDPVRRALLVESFRADLQWWESMVARLDGETPPHPAVAAEVDLNRLRDAIARPVSPVAEDDRADLHSRGERLHHAMLIRRVREEVAHSLDGMSPQELWAHRLMLCRLQAELESPDIASGETTEEDAATWAARLEEHRRALAIRAEALIDKLPAAEHRALWEEILEAARGEANEVVTILEELPLAQAVRLLELATRDLEELARLGREREEETRALDDSLRIGPPVRRVARMARIARAELQEKRLELSLNRRFGPRFVGWLENLVLLLILVMTGLIAAESLLENTGRLDDFAAWAFAWADLAISLVFLFEFLIKWSHADGKWLYLKRHFFVDFLPSIPFGFLSQVAWSFRLTKGGVLSEFFWFLEISRLIRYVRVARPIIRVARLAIFSMRFIDRLVRRSAPVINRGIVLFQPHGLEDFESRNRHLLVSLRRRQDERSSELIGRLEDPERLQVMGWVLGDLESRIDRLPTVAITAAGVETEGREVPVESVVERLVRMTPDRLVEQMGQEFVTSLDRYIRLLDLPLIRRLPVVRDLVIHRDKGPAESAALAVNYFGHLIQRFLDIAYYLADLQGTVSPPLFLDRLGSTIVSATRGPARRLLMLGSAFLALYVLVDTLAILSPIRGLFDKIKNLLGLPVIVLGLVCLVFWILGGWFRRIANQASEFSERVVEAQFAAQTKQLKAGAARLDARFLAERVIVPEIALRGHDGQSRAINDLIQKLDSAPTPPTPAELILLDPEMSFLRNVNLLYRDYLDGSPFHVSDTKATTQLLGNMALSNLRRSHLELSLRGSKRLAQLDLSRAGRLLGGPYLWFQYITRMVAQDTAQLLVDFNMHAVPLERLACASRPVRTAYRQWLSRRLRVPEEAVEMPEPVGRYGDAELPSDASLRGEANGFFETVEFTAIDFLGNNPERDAEIEARYGRQVVELLHADRRRNVRRAFRSFPLHRLPQTQRTINFFLIYEHYIGGGRVLLLPIRMVGWAAQGLAFAVRGIVRIVRAILHPVVSGVEDEPDEESFAAALRKIHRMRKPAFMESLWFRARCDVEYLGLPLPGLPAPVGTETLLEQDLDFIGATRQDRLRADRLRAELGVRANWAGRWLDRFGWNAAALPGALERDFPHLPDRGGEVVRALVMAVVIDFRDVYTLGTAIEGLARVIAHAADPASDPRQLPAALPEPFLARRPLWHRAMGRIRPIDSLLALPCFPALGPEDLKRVKRYLRRHRRTVGGWVWVLRVQGGPDPWETLRSRLREVLVRSDLWSDQILVLRTIQTLTMLDVHHYCELVRGLGGYAQDDREGVTGTLPFALEGVEDESMAPAY